MVQCSVGPEAVTHFTISGRSLGPAPPPRPPWAERIPPEPVPPRPPAARHPGPGARWRKAFWHSSLARFKGFITLLEIFMGLARYE